MAFMRCCIRGAASRAKSPPNGPAPEQVSLTMDNLSQVALFEAAENGDRDEVRRHIEGGFDINAVDPEDAYTAVLLAAECGKIGVVQDLVEAGADVNARDSFGRSALYAAAVAGHVDVVTFLCHAGADAGVRDEDGRTAFWACCALRFIDVAEVLLDVAKVDIDVCDHSGMSSLQHATDSGHADVIDFLKSRGAQDQRKGRLAV